MIAKALQGMQLLEPGNNLAELCLAGLRAAGIVLAAGDVLVFASKIISKSEGRALPLSQVKPSPAACEIAQVCGKDPRLVELILAESSQVLRLRPGLIVVEHRLGFICANAAVDESNVGEENTVILLPRDPDNSARRICAALEETFAVRLGVVITDTFGRPWRMGLVNVAIGLANVPAQVSLVGDQDAFGRELAVTIPALADEIAAASGLLMSKNGKTPAILFQGVDWEPAPSSATDLIRPQKEDIFR